MRRDYRSKNGKKLPGVTNVIGVLDKPGLRWWAYKQGWQNYERLCELIMNYLNAWDRSRDDQLALGIKRIISDFVLTKLYDARDKAADAGTLAHSMIEVYLTHNGYVDMAGYPEDIIQKATACFESFKQWEKAHQFKIVGNELPMVSKLGFGGTLDLGLVTDELNIMDFKTGKDIYFSHYVQLSAYGLLWDENNPDNLVKGYRILQLGDGEFTEKFIQDLSHEREIFLCCLKIYQILQEVGQKL